MANLIKPPLLDETGKAILAALQGEEPAENTGSKIKAPMSDETGKAILEFLQNGGGGGGGGPLKVMLTKKDAYTVTADKTMKEIREAAQTTGLLVGEYDSLGDAYHFALVPLYSYNLTSDVDTMYLPNDFGSSSYLYQNYSDDETDWNIPD